MFAGNVLSVSFAFGQAGVPKARIVTAVLDPVKDGGGDVASTIFRYAAAYKARSDPGQLLLTLCVNAQAAHPCYAKLGGLNMVIDFGLTTASSGLRALHGPSWRAQRSRGSGHRLGGAQGRRGRIMSRGRRAISRGASLAQGAEMIFSHS